MLLLKDNEDPFDLGWGERSDRRDNGRTASVSPTRKTPQLPKTTAPAGNDRASSARMMGTQVRDTRLDGPEIRRLRAKIAQWLSIPDIDMDVIDFILAVFKSHDLPGDPLWGIVVDASGGGKTEILRALHNLKQAYFLSKLTEKTLVSGYRDPAHPHKDPSLLPELNEKVLIIKDLAPLLSMRRESRNAIIGELRDAYDGFTDQGRGNVGRVSYKARFSLLAASTLAIERFDAIDNELGERFIKFRGRATDSVAKVKKAMENVGTDDSMRHDIEKAVTNYLASLPRMLSTQIPESLRERLTQLADFTARARSHVSRDHGHEIQYLPRPEVGTRLGKELGKLLLALAVIRRKAQPDEQEFETVERVAEDCLPPNRLAIINALRDSREPLRLVTIESATGLPHVTAYRALEDLKVLGLAEKVDENGGESAWILVNSRKLAP